MASEMTISHHTCEGLLRFILPKDTVTVDMEVIPLSTPVKVLSIEMKLQV